MVTATGLMALCLASLTNEASVEAMMFDIGHALTDHGAAVRTLLYSNSAQNPQLLVGLLELMRSSGLPGVVISCNGKSELILEDYPDRPPHTIHDAWNLPLIAQMVDHPAHHEPQLRRMPEKTLVTLIDEGHLRYLNEMGIRAQAAIFCPHGGPRPLAEQRATTERPIDLLFVGHLAKQPSYQDWLRANGGGEPLRSVLAEGYAAVVDGNIEPYQALYDGFARRGVPVTASQICPLVRALDGYSSQVRRLNVLKAIRSHRVTLYGEVAPEVLPEVAHHDLKGTINYVQAVNLMAESKIVLNSRLTFARGAHERAFYGLSRGAIIANEESSFLTRELDEGLGFTRLPADDSAIDGHLAELLASPDRLDDMRTRGLPHYAAHHTWLDRTERMLNGLRAAQLI